MNEMYNMSIVAHSSFVFLILGIVGINYLILWVSNDFIFYKRKRELFYAPLDSLGIGGIIFTGIVMMAAKHLSFSIENILMIVVSILFIFLEVKRSKGLKLVNSLEKFLLYKNYAKKILLSEFIITLVISLWMWR